MFDYIPLSDRIAFVLRVKKSSLLEPDDPDDGSITILRNIPSSPANITPYARVLNDLWRVLLQYLRGFTVDPYTCLVLNTQIKWKILRCGLSVCRIIISPSVIVNEY